MSLYLCPIAGCRWRENGTDIAAQKGTVSTFPLRDMYIYCQLGKSTPKCPETIRAWLERAKIFYPEDITATCWRHCRTLQADMLGRSR